MAWTSTATAFHRIDRQDRLGVPLREDTTRLALDLLLVNKVDRIEAAGRANCFTPVNFGIEMTNAHP